MQQDTSNRPILAKTTHAVSAMDVLPWLWWVCGMWAYCYLPWSKRQNQLTPGWLGRTSRWKKFFQKCLKNESIHFGWRQPYYIPLLISTILGKRECFSRTQGGHAPYTMEFAGAAGNLERFWSAKCWRFSYVFPGAWGPYVGSLRKNEDETNFTDMEINMFVDLLGPDIPYEHWGWSLLYSSLVNILWLFLGNLCGLVAVNQGDMLRWLNGIR